MKTVIGVVVVLLLGVASASDREHSVTWLIDQEEAQRVGDDFDWQHLGPLDFLAHLKQELRENTIPIYTVWGYHRGWILESDLPALRTLLTSTDPCAALQSPLSSVISEKGSTIGKVAQQMIDGYESGGFPAWNSVAARFYNNVIPATGDDSSVKSVATEPNGQG